MEISTNQSECLFESCDTGSDADEGNKASFVKTTYSLNNILVINKGLPLFQSFRESKEKNSVEYSKNKNSSESLELKAEALFEEIKRSESEQIAKPKRIYRKVLIMISSTTILRQLM